MLDDEPLDAVVPYAQEYLPDWMCTTFPVQGSQEPMDLPALPPAGSDSPGPSNIFTQSHMELPDITATNPFEGQLDTPRLLASPTRQPAPETSAGMIPNQIGSQNEILFQMCKSTLPQPPFHSRNGNCD